MMTMPRWHKWFALLQIVKSAWLVEVKKFDMELPETGFSALIPSLYLGRVQIWHRLEAIYSSANIQTCFWGYGIY